MKLIFHKDILKLTDLYKEHDLFLNLTKSLGVLVFLSFVPMEEKPDSFKYFLTISACDCV